MRIPEGRVRYHAADITLRVPTEPGEIAHAYVRFSFAGPEAVDRA